MAGGVVAGSPPVHKVGNVVCDLDGVLYLGDDPIPGAGAALGALEQAGWRIVLVTNNSTKAQRDIATRVARITGYEPDPGRVLGSGLAAARMLGTGPAFVVGERGLAATLLEEGVALTEAWREAAAVVVGLDRDFAYPRLRDAVFAVRGGARFVATNLDPTYPTPEGMWPGGGSMAAAIATAAGVEPEVAGKPYPPMRALIRDRLGPGPTWAVGDRADTDLEMGRLEGWSRVLVLSGATADASGLEGDHFPELVLASIADLPALLGSPPG